MRRLCHEYKRKYNGGHAYETFNLSDEMTYNGQYEKIANRKVNRPFILAPSASKDRNPLRWEEYKWEQKSVMGKSVAYDKLETIFLPEFMNRYSYVSSFAWLINSCFETKGFKRGHAVRLLYVALLTPSQIQFQLVVQHLMKQFKPKNNLCFEYIKHCEENALCANGGPQPRFMAGQKIDLPDGIEEIEENLEQIEHAIDSLNNGEMLDKNGVFVDNKTVVDVKGIGATRAISFPSLCCFIGFGTSEYAIQTAKQAILNSETGNRYAGDKGDQLSKLGQKLKVDGDSPPYDNSYYHSILEAAGKSVGEVQSTMENASCAITRTKKSHDMFIKNQTLYCLFLDTVALKHCNGDEESEEEESIFRSTVYEKKFGSIRWSEANLPQWQ